MKKFITTIILSCLLAFGMNGIANAAHQQGKTKRYHFRVPSSHVLKATNSSDYVYLKGRVVNDSAISIYSDNFALDYFLPHDLSARSSASYSIAIPVSQGIWTAETNYVDYDGYGGCHVEIQGSFDFVRSYTNLDIAITSLDDESRCYMRGMDLRIDITPVY